MKVGIIQSNYIPWKGYFDFIDDVDLFIFHDDLQYTKGDWRNRNKVNTKNGLQWLTVPVKYQHVSQTIDATPVDYRQPWTKKHLNMVREHYHKAPFFQPYFDEYVWMLSEEYGTISDLNIALTTWIMKRLSIITPVKRSSELHPSGSKTERLIGLLKTVGATTYVSGPAARDYLIPEEFEKNNIALEYKSYQYLEYQQQVAPFEHGVTVLDLIFNQGTNVREYFKSTVPNTIIVGAHELTV